MIHAAMEGGRDKPGGKVGRGGGTSGTEGVTDGVREGRTAFVRVATWIR